MKKKQVTTIDNILKVDDIKGILEEINSNLLSINELVVIFTRDNGEDVGLRWNGMRDSRICYLCQLLIHHLMEKTEDA